MKHTFLFNGIEVPNLTMDEAINCARERVINNGKAVVLKVRTNAGSWLMLGTYAPVAKDLWEYHENQDDMKSPLIPVVCAEPAMPTSGSQRAIRTIKAVFMPGKTKSEDKYRLIIGGKPDPLNREFCCNPKTHVAAIKDLQEWFKTMKRAGYYPLVEAITFA